MLLGVDRIDDLRTDPLVVQRWAGILVSVLVGAGLLFVVLEGTVTGAKSSTGKLSGEGGDVYDIASHLFTDYLFAFEIRSLLLVIGVVGAVALARRSKDPAPLIDADEPAGDFTDPYTESMTRTPSEPPVEEAAP
jgi:NADH-quinone oxidoreductase subunit J